MSRFQFSLRMLLAAAAVVGVGAGLWVAEPSWPVGVFEALLLVFIPAAAITLAVSSTGTAKTWWIGIATASAFTAILPFVQSTLLLMHDETIVESPMAYPMRFAGAMPFSFRSAILGWAFSPVVGLLCVFTHWLFIRPADPQD